MRAFVVIATLFLAATCSASYHAALSSQYHTQDHYGQYSYGYADPNSQKHETRSADGVTHGGYSYVDGNGLVQSVSYVADPHHGFRASGTNLPQAPVAVAPIAHVAAAPWAYATPYAHAAPYAHAVLPLTAHGVPADTPEVAAAKAAHFAAHAAARSGHHLYKRSLWGGHAYASPWAHAAAPVIHNGVPVDTPEVQHAKAAHFAAHANALGAAHVAPYAAHYNGAPVDTPEVQHAKAAHFAAHAAASHGAVGAVAHAHSGAYHVPVIHNGVPVDTPEVQHARAAHHAALAEASSRAHLADAHYGSAGHYAPAAHYAPAHHGPIHIPVIHNGVPVETPEVQHAKAAHFAAVAEASSRSHGHYDDGHWDDGHYAHHAW